MREYGISVTRIVPYKDQVIVFWVICKFMYLVSIMENGEQKSIVFG